MLFFKTQQHFRPPDQGVLPMMQASRTEKYQQMREMLNEKQWRHYLALEAQECKSQDSVGENHIILRVVLWYCQLGNRAEQYAKIPS